MTTQKEIIDISNLPYSQQNDYKWKAIEPMKRNGNKSWTRKYQCQKTGKIGFRSGSFL